MKTIERLIEIPLFELQTERAKSMDITTGNYCAICGLKLKQGTKTKMVHLLENGNIINYQYEDIANSQGLFPVGSECAKKLNKNYLF